MRKGAGLDSTPSEASGLIGRILSMDPRQKHSARRDEEEIAKTLARILETRRRPSLREEP